MDILQQCQKWHEDDKHHKIMDALEAIPADKRTGDIDMKLARAYNNMGNSETLKGRQMLKHALKLMQVHEDELGTTYLWNSKLLIG